MSPRKPLAASAAVTAALALAIPAASANAATTTHAVRTPASLGVGGQLSPGSLGCGFLVSQLPFAQRPGNTLYLNFIANVLLYSGCGGAAI
jgi:hypothetical protein